MDSTAAIQPTTLVGGDPHAPRLRYKANSAAHADDSLAFLTPPRNKSIAAMWPEPDADDHATHHVDDSASSTWHTSEQRTSIAIRVLDDNDDDCATTRKDEPQTEAIDAKSGVFEATADDCEMDASCWSAPSELGELERKGESTSQSSVNDDEAEDEFELGAGCKMRRSCSAPSHVELPLSSFDSNMPTTKKHPREAPLPVRVPQSQSCGFTLHTAVGTRQSQNRELKFETADNDDDQGDKRAVEVAIRGETLSASTTSDERMSIDADEAAGDQSLDTAENLSTCDNNDRMREGEGESESGDVVSSPKEKRRDSSVGRLCHAFCRLPSRSLMPQSKSDGQLSLASAYASAAPILRPRTPIFDESRNASDDESDLSAVGSPPAFVARRPLPHSCTYHGEQLADGCRSVQTTATMPRWGRSFIDSLQQREEARREQRRYRRERVGSIDGSHQNCESTQLENSEIVTRPMRRETTVEFSWPEAKSFAAATAAVTAVDNDDDSENEEPWTMRTRMQRSQADRCEPTLAQSCSSRGADIPAIQLGESDDDDEATPTILDDNNLSQQSAASQDDHFVAESQCETILESANENDDDQDDDDEDDDGGGGGGIVDEAHRPLELFAQLRDLRCTTNFDDDMVSSERSTCVMSRKCKNEQFWPHSQAQEDVEAKSGGGRRRLLLRALRLLFIELFGLQDYARARFIAMPREHKPRILVIDRRRNKRELAGNSSVRARAPARRRRRCRGHRRRVARRWRF